MRLQLPSAALRHQDQAAPHPAGPAHRSSGSTAPASPPPPGTAHTPA
jgi:hypothetical protein